MLRIACVFYFHFRLFIYRLIIVMRPDSFYLHTKRVRLHIGHFISALRLKLFLLLFKYGSANYIRAVLIQFYLSLFSVGSCTLMTIVVISGTIDRFEKGKTKRVC